MKRQLVKLLDIIPMSLNCKSRRFMVSHCKSRLRILSWWWFLQLTIRNPLGSKEVLSISRSLVAHPRPIVFPAYDHRYMKFLPTVQHVRAEQSTGRYILLVQPFEEWGRTHQLVRELPCINCINFIIFIRFSLPCVLWVVWNSTVEDICDCCRLL